MNSWCLTNAEKIQLEHTRQAKLRSDPENPFWQDRDAVLTWATRKKLTTINGSWCNQKTVKRMRDAVGDMA